MLHIIETAEPLNCLKGPLLERHTVSEPRRAPTPIRSIVVREPPREAQGCPMGGRHEALNPSR